MQCGQVFKGDAAGIALKFRDKCRIRLPRGGTEAHVDAGFRPLAGDVVRAASAEWHVDDEDRLVSQRHQIDGRDQLGRDPVIDEAGDAFLLGERVIDAHDRAVICDPDDEPPTRGVREGNDRPQRTVGRRQIALELEGLTLSVCYAPICSEHQVVTHAGVPPAGGDEAPRNTSGACPSASHIEVKCSLSTWSMNVNSA